MDGKITTQNPERREKRSARPLFHAVFFAASRPDRLGERGDNVLKELWCCVGGEYYEIIWFVHECVCVVCIWCPFVANFPY